jgi:hypothetical protein
MKRGAETRAAITAALTRMCRELGRLVGRSDVFEAPEVVVLRRTEAVIDNALMHMAEQRLIFRRRAEPGEPGRGSYRYGPPDWKDGPAQLLPVVIREKKPHRKKAEPLPIANAPAVVALRFDRDNGTVLLEIKGHLLLDLGVKR